MKMEDQILSLCKNGVIRGSIIGLYLKNTPVISWIIIMPITHYNRLLV